MRAYLTIAWHNLLQARVRTLLLTLAVGVVTLLLVVLSAVSRGFTDSLMHGGTALATGHVNIAGWYKNKPSDAWPMIQGTDDIVRLAREHTPGLVNIVARDRAWAKVIGPSHSFFVSPSGIDIRSESRLRAVLQLARESEYQPGGRDVVTGDLDRLAAPHTALVFASQARRLGVGVGDYLTLTAPTGQGRTNTVDVTVVAVARDLGFMSNWNLFVPSADIHELYQTSDDTTSVVMLYLEDPTRAEAVMGYLRERLAEAGYTVMPHAPQAFFFKFETVAGEDWTGQRLDLTTWDDEVSYIAWVSTALDAITAILVGILMAINVVGIMNAMWMSVRRRTVEIGTARAIGMSRGGVMAMFMLEATLIGLFATTLGGLGGAALAVGLDAAQIGLPPAVAAILMSDTLHLVVAPGQILVAIVAFTAVAALSALTPALRAARLQPVTAIHHAG